jgi:uncharacterized protein
MKLSRATIIVPVPGRTDHLLVQPITGQAALLEARFVQALQDPNSAFDVPGMPVDDLLQAGFLVESDDADREQLAEAYATWLEDVEQTPTQLIFVPTLACNLRCTYCYQEAFDPAASTLVAPSTIDAFFAWIDRFHAGDSVKPYVTLFGGEPLIDSASHRDRVERVLRQASERGLQVAIVTNGYDLAAFADLLAQGPIKEVQVTIDGPAAVHDRRRPHGSGRGSFDRIVQGVEAIIARSIPVNLRVVVDRDNIESLPELATMSARKGWLDLPESAFKTQIGRNYELFGCAAGQRRDRLFDRVGLWARYVELAQEHPELARFHRPRFHGVSHLADHGELPAPNFDACPATKKEWAFDADGSVYGCTATVGNPRYKLGTYAPTIALDEEAVAAWRNRNVFSIPSCQDCRLAPVCGGGCGALAHREHGSILAPDCRPVRELMGLGVKYYDLGNDGTSDPA